MRKALLVVLAIMTAGCAQVEDSPGPGTSAQAGTATGHGTGGGTGTAGNGTGGNGTEAEDRESWAGNRSLTLTQQPATFHGPPAGGPNCLTAKPVGSVRSFQLTLDWDAGKAAELQLLAYSIATDRTLASATGPPPLRLEQASIDAEDGTWVTWVAQLPADATQPVDGLALTLTYAYTLSQAGEDDLGEATCSVYPPYGYGLIPH